MRRGPRAFTLIELLVVISIIFLLIGMLMPSFGKAREQARRTTCMANLHSIGQSLYVYGEDNHGRLVPGDWRVGWDVWAWVTEGEGCGTDRALNNQPVNLGHLLSANKIPMPTANNHTFFCPSSKTLSGSGPCNDFKGLWGSATARASIKYMFNTSLDGFDEGVLQGKQAVLSHKDKVNFLVADTSVQVFNVKPVVFDISAGSETIPQVCQRYGLCFPDSMLHGWFERGSVDVNEARDFLANPNEWSKQHATGTSPKPALIANMANKSITSDIVGALGGDGLTRPPSG